MHKLSVLLIALFCLLRVAYAAEIKQIQVDLQGTHYVLSADIDYQLSDKAKEALVNGVPLFWTLHIKVQQQRELLWADTLLDKSIRYRLQYHALLNMYRVVITQSDGKTSDSYNFSTLSAALDLMATVRDVSLIEASLLQADKQTIVKIKAEFERDALPLPLRPIAYTNPQWYLSSDWLLWTFKK
jgi:hypothetical protein